jgi:hypothetical protein
VNAGVVDEESVFQTLRVTFGGCHDLRCLTMNRFSLLACDCVTNSHSVLYFTGNFGKILSACGQQEIQYTDLIVSPVHVTRLYV